MKLTAHYTSFAEYMAACDSDSSKRVAHYAEQERQAAEEAQMRRDAERYRWMRQHACKEGDDGLSEPFLTPEQFDEKVDEARAVKQ